MEEKQKWRLKKCCCLPLRTGALVLAYFNMIEFTFLYAIIEFSFIGSGDDILKALDVIYNMNVDEGVLDFLTTLLNSLRYWFSLALIYALHERKAKVLLAYLCYLVVHIASTLLVLFTTLFYFDAKYFPGFVISLDLMYDTFIFLVVYSMRAEILYGGTDSALPQYVVTDGHQTAAKAPLEPSDDLAVDGEEKTSV